jgi:hypothetical protein
MSEVANPRGEAGYIFLTNYLVYEKYYLLSNKARSQKRDVGILVHYNVAVAFEMLLVILARFPLDREIVTQTDYIHSVDNFRFRARLKV